jgi:CrcB protein
MSAGAADSTDGLGELAAVTSPRKPDRYGLRASYIALVMVGGGAGVLSRYGLEETVSSSSGWPLATLLINLSGAWALGGLLEALHRRGPDIGIRRSLRLLLGTGFLGGFTTYSALALESVLLLALEDNSSAAIYLALSLFGGALASWAGIWCGAAFDRRTLARRAASETKIPRNRDLVKEENS